jgi:methylated-DNA-[protein]-cysteine S-methyltransferase
VNKLPEHLYLERLATPIGEALVVTDEAGCLRALDWSDHKDDMLGALRKQYGEVALESGTVSSEIKTRLRDYFDGEINCLAAIEWRASGTPFQQAVWRLSPQSRQEIRAAIALWRLRLGVRRRFAPWAEPMAQTRLASWCPVIE